MRAMLRTRGETDQAVRIDTIDRQIAEATDAVAQGVLNGLRGPQTNHLIAQGSQTAGNRGLAKANAINELPRRHRAGGQLLAYRFLVPGHWS